MRLYLVQHGKATSKEEDPDRPLTDAGRREVRAVADFVRPLGLEVDRMWRSGKTRAKQTAEILARVMTVAKGPTAQQGLAPDDYVTPLRDELGATSEDTMIVGHMPFVSRLAALLLTGFESPPVVTFVNAGLVCLERTGDNRWQVEWSVTPELLGD
ncbi:MAG: phosphohistidine phosphatase SixA [Phycisphaerales bacterium]|nr:MAG: phosphohistidine phosphatase SixA [Phycisphaerales bacterium]